MGIPHQWPNHKPSRPGTVVAVEKRCGQSLAAILSNVQSGCTRKSAKRIEKGCDKNKSNNDDGYVRIRLQWYDRLYPTGIFWEQMDMLYAVSMSFQSIAYLQWMASPAIHGEVIKVDSTDPLPMLPRIRRCNLMVAIGIDASHFILRGCTLWPLKMEVIWIYKLIKSGSDLDWHCTLSNVLCSVPLWNQILFHVISFYSIALASELRNLGKT